MQEQPRQSSASDRSLSPAVADSKVSPPPLQKSADSGSGNIEEEAASRRLARRLSSLSTVTDPRLPLSDVLGRNFPCRRHQRAMRHFSEWYVAKLEDNLEAKLKRPPTHKGMPPVFRRAFPGEPPMDRRLGRRIRHVYDRCGEELADFRQRLQSKALRDSVSSFRATLPSSSTLQRGGSPVQQSPSSSSLQQQQQEQRSLQSEPSLLWPSGYTGGGARPLPKVAAAAHVRPEASLRPEVKSPTSRGPNLRTSIRADRRSRAEASATASPLATPKRRASSSSAVRLEATAGENRRRSKRPDLAEETSTEEAKPLPRHQRSATASSSKPIVSQYITVKTIDGGKRKLKLSPLGPEALPFMPPDMDLWEVQDASGYGPPTFTPPPFPYYRPHMMPFPVYPASGAVPQAISPFLSCPPSPWDQPQMATAPRHPLPMTNQFTPEEHARQQQVAPQQLPPQFTSQYMSQYPQTACFHTASSQPAPIAAMSTPTYSAQTQPPLTQLPQPTQSAHSVDHANSQESVVRDCWSLLTPTISPNGYVTWPDTFYQWYSPLLAQPAKPPPSAAVQQLIAPAPQVPRVVVTSPGTPGAEVTSRELEEPPNADGKRSLDPSTPSPGPQSIETTQPAGAAQSVAYPKRSDSVPPLPDEKMTPPVPPAPLPPYSSGRESAGFVVPDADAAVHRLSMTDER